ncbi:MAG: iron-containing redox enzyme family protein [Ilumatobacteraceae bacterium]|nr:iron-containing redox enzyme family protein [Ilumatobacteraceae bacterium]
MTVIDKTATSAFEDALWAEVEAGSVRNFQPFQAAMVAGELTRDQLGMWAAQQYAIVRPFKSWLAGIHTNCTLESAEHHIIENMWEEMGFGEPGKDHPALFEKFADALGWPRERMAANVVAETSAFVGYYSWATRCLPFEESMALVGLVIEGNPRARGSITTVETTESKRELWEALSAEYNLTRDEVEFWELHTSADVVHAQRSMEIIIDAAPEAAQQERVISRVREGFQVWGLKQAGIGRAIASVAE